MLGRDRNSTWAGRWRLAVLLCALASYSVVSLHVVSHEFGEFSGCEICSDHSNPHNALAVTTDVQPLLVAWTLAVPAPVRRPCGVTFTAHHPRGPPATTV